MKQINPAVRREAEWFDGIPSQRDLEDIAARLGVPLHVEMRPTARQETPRRPDLAPKQTLLRCAEFRVRDCRRQLADAERELLKRRADLEALEREMAA